MKKGKFNRKRGARRSFLKNLMHNLIIKERITTTESRAKALRPKVERLVSLAKKQNLASLRLLLQRLPHQSSAFKLYHEIAPKYKERAGGYLRIIKIGLNRKRDAAKMVRLEWIT